MFQHLQHCGSFLKTMTLYQLPDIDTNVSRFKDCTASAVSDNWKTLTGSILVSQRRLTLND